MHSISVFHIYLQMVGINVGDAFHFQQRWRVALGEDGSRTVTYADIEREPNIGIAKQHQGNVSWYNNGILVLLWWHNISVSRPMIIYDINSFGDYWYLLYWICRGKFENWHNNFRCLFDQQMFIILPLTMDDGKW